MAEIVPQKTRDNNAFRPSQQTFGALINMPVNGMPPPPPPPGPSMPPLPASSMPPPPASMLPPPAHPIDQPHLQQLPPSHFAARDQAHHVHVTSESPPERRDRSLLPNNVDTDSGDELPIIPPSTPVLPPTSVTGSVSRAQSQSQSQSQS
ncbi:hypothetical protein PILCRDRAFT_221 [Piloderma croceum F 1598]|uniref:Uncharacterized protein n=1 Tax=Piloderma croceum (strain F 1598) TaxID=765440 RepID=A0A0C3GNP6_PILCF|nr:hypothetical protein PILCRDRAFT_221 [Piloderma croceum F 1598]